MRRIETASLALALTAFAAAGTLLAQQSPAPAAPPAASAPPPAAPPAPVATAPAESPAPAPAPTGPGADVDDEFVPTQELNADDQVTFPVDI